MEIRILVQRLITSRNSLHLSEPPFARPRSVGHSAPLPRLPRGFAVRIYRNTGHEAGKRGPHSIFHATAHVKATVYLWVVGCF